MKKRMPIFFLFSLLIIGCKERQTDATSTKVIEATYANNEEWIVIEAQQEEDIILNKLVYPQSKKAWNESEATLRGYHRYDIKLVQKDGPQNWLWYQVLNVFYKVDYSIQKWQEQGYEEKKIEQGKIGIITLWSGKHNSSFLLPIWPEGTKIKKLVVCARPTSGFINRLWPVSIETWAGQTFTNSEHICTSLNEDKISPDDMKKVDSMNNDR